MALLDTKFDGKESTGDELEVASSEKLLPESTLAIKAGTNVSGLLIGAAELPVSRERPPGGGSEVASGD